MQSQGQEGNLEPVNACGKASHVPVLADLLIPKEAIKNDAKIKDVSNNVVGLFDSIIFLDHHRVFR